MNRFACLIGLFIASCLILLAIPLYTIFWVYPQFEKIVTFEKEVSAKQIANHISKMLVMDIETKQLTKKSITKDFVETLKEAQADFDLVNIKIFSSKGEVLYSIDGKGVGSVNTNPYFTDVVSRGKLYSKVVHENEETMEGEVVKKDVVEAYVPLMRDRKFIGAFEIYYDITYSRYSLGTFVERSRVIIILVTMFLLSCVLMISFSAITCIKKRRKAEEEIQKLKDQVPPLLRGISDDK